MSQGSAYLPHTASHAAEPSPSAHPMADCSALKAVVTPRLFSVDPTAVCAPPHATHAARRLTEMADNLAGIVAIELLASCQGVHLRRPLRSSPALEDVVEQVHGVAPPFDEDRFFAPSIEAAKSLIVEGRFRALVPPEILPAG